MKLTIGMATYKDFDGVYFTIQALRLYHDLGGAEIIVVDNFGCDATRDFVTNWSGGRYIRYDGDGGTSGPRNHIFEAASGDIVLCLDCHVMLLPGAIAKLRDYYTVNPHCQDLLQGPLLYDDLIGFDTHFDPIWRSHMWGVWAKDPRGADPTAAPFDIPMQGLGLFCSRRDAWLGFNKKFRGFGGEEGYIHEKYRQAGRRCLCLPWLKWLHRFWRPHGVPYRLDITDRIRNYFIGHQELRLDPGPIFEHFQEYVPKDTLLSIARSVYGAQDLSKYA